MEALDRSGNVLIAPQPLQGKMIKPPFPLKVENLKHCFTEAEKCLKAYIPFIIKFNYIALQCRKLARVLLFDNRIQRSRPLLSHSARGWILSLFSTCKIPLTPSVSQAMMGTQAQSRVQSQKQSFCFYTITRCRIFTVEEMRGS